MASYTSAANGTLAALIIKPSIPLTETFAWLTDLQQAFNGSESYVQVRDKPRYSVNYQHEYQADQKADVFNTVYGAIRSKWALPIWVEAQYIGSQSGSTILCDTTNYTFVVGDMALIYVSNYVWLLADVTAVDSVSVTIDGSATGYSGAYIVPVKVARPIGDVNQVSTGLDGSMTISYRIDESNDFTPSIPEQFLGNDIYFDARLKPSNDQVQSSISARQLYADYELGKVDEFTPWLNSQVSQAVMVYLKSRSEYLAFRDWLYRRAGRHSVFWRPSFERDFDIISVGNITTSIDVEKNSFTVLTPDRLHFAIQTVDGTWFARTVTAVTSLTSTTMRLTWSGSIGAVPVSSILRMCYLGLRRLAQDSIDIKWISGVMAQCQYSDVEVAP